MRIAPIIAAACIIVLTATAAHAQSGLANLCWTSEDWPEGTTRDGFNVLWSDPTDSPFIAVVTDAGPVPVNSSGRHVFQVPVPEDPILANVLRFQVVAYGRDANDKYIETAPSRALDITCTEFGAVGGPNICPSDCPECPDCPPPPVCMPGDVDCDGRVTASDALAVARIAVGLPVISPECEP